MGSSPRVYLKVYVCRVYSSEETTLIVQLCSLNTLSTLPKSQSTTQKWLSCLLTGAELKDITYSVLSEERQKAQVPQTY